MRARSPYNDVAKIKAFLFPCVARRGKFRDGTGYRRELSRATGRTSSIKRLKAVRLGCMQDKSVFYSRKDINKEKCSQKRKGLGWASYNTVKFKYNTVNWAVRRFLK
ncbi:MAG: hypothetical protein ACE5I5_16155 [Candidatus Heimdallarchaeota archaeon]